MSLNPPQDYRKTEFTHRRGLASARPAAGDVLPGTLYFSTDTSALERSDGSTWSTYAGAGGGGGGPVWFPDFTTPVLGDFTWVNQGSATATTIASGIIIDGPILAGDNVKALVKTLPAIPYTVTSCIIPDMVNTNYHTVGMILRESGTSKIIEFGPTWNGSYSIGVINFTNPTTWAGTPLNFVKQYESPIWLRIGRVGTTLTYYTSADGYNWRTVYSTALTAFFTTAPDQVGMFVNTNNPTYPCSQTWLSWSIT